MTSVSALAVRVGGREYPVVLPTLRDPRLHVAAVIISIHVLGQVGLGFRVSVPQILAAILAAAVIEVVLTVRRTGRLVWPASALLTGSGVALIFRVLGTEAGDHWSTRGWYLFAVVAGASVLSKYVIRYRGTPLFNPSNVGLVVAFLLLGSGRVEPLDFWWGPLDLWMALAYGVILVGGAIVASRLRLLPMALGFWVTFTAAIGVLAASGHCITARWAFEPVCGGHFWWVLTTSPEVLVFLFFMLTDPKTIPTGKTTRIAFGALVAVTATVLIAPQPTEFGAKVALLGSLVVLTGLRPVFDRLVLPAEADRSPRFALWRLFAAPRATQVAGRVLVAGIAVAIVAVTVVAAGAPARSSSAVGGPLAFSGDEPVAVEGVIDAAALPAATVDDEVVKLDAELAGPGAQLLAEALAAALATESAALRAGDAGLLAAVDSWARLDKMENLIEEAATTGLAVVPSAYRFESLRLVVTFPFGPQAGAVPGIEALGSVEEVTYDATGAEVDRSTIEIGLTYALRQSDDGRWFIVDARPVE